MKYKKFMPYLLGLMLMFSLVSATTYYNTPIGNVEIIEYNNGLYDRISLFFSNLSPQPLLIQPITSGTSQEQLVINKVNNVMIAFKPICDSGTPLISDVRIAKDNKLLQKFDISSKLSCNLNANIKISFTPLEAGNYQIVYKVLNKNTGERVNIDVGVSTPMIVDFESVTLTAGGKLPEQFKPYCKTISTQEIQVGGELVGIKKNVYCYTTSTEFDEKVIVECSNGYVASNDNYDYATCEKPQEEEIITDIPEEEVIEEDLVIPSEDTFTDDISNYDNTKTENVSYLNQIFGLDYYGYYTYGLISLLFIGIVVYLSIPNKKRGRK